MGAWTGAWIDARIELWIVMGSFPPQKGRIP
jgi:hypothetical protein